MQINLLENERFNYTAKSREFDSESGFYYYRARYYSAEIGRFLQVDPDSGQLANPNTHINKYSYVGNNPIMFVDPTGAIKLKRAFAIAISPWTLAVRPFLSEKQQDRLDNITIAVAVVAAAIYLAPATAAVALGATAYQNRNAKGNFFDNLDDFTLDFAITFGILYASNGGQDISFTSGPFWNQSFTLVPIGKAITKEYVGRKISEHLCNNSYLPEIEKPFEDIGIISDRGRNEKCE